MRKRSFKSNISVDDPSQLYDYVKIINPKVWILLLGCVFALLALLFELATRTIFDGLVLAAVCKDKETKVYLGEDDLSKVSKGMDVLIKGRKYYVTEIEKVDDDDLQNYYYLILDVSDVQPGENIYSFKFEADLKDGTYTANIPTEGDVISKYLLKGE